MSLRQLKKRAASKKAAKPKICPFCEQPRVGPRDECGGEGEGICDEYADAIDGKSAVVQKTMLKALRSAKRALLEGFRNCGRDLDCVYAEPLKKVNAAIKLAEGK